MAENSKNFTKEQPTVQRPTSLTFTAQLLLQWLTGTKRHEACQTFGRRHMYDSQKTRRKIHLIDATYSQTRRCIIMWTCFSVRTEAEWADRPAGKYWEIDLNWSKGLHFSNTTQCTLIRKNWGGSKNKLALGSSGPVSRDLRRSVHRNASGWDRMMLFKFVRSVQHC